MRLHEAFIRTAKRYEKKIAVVDRATNQRVTYKDVLIRALILSEKLKSADPGFVGIMVPTSAGCIYAMLAVLFSGRTPVMINYSTGAVENCRDAQRRLAFRTILTSRKLLERIKCPQLDGMVCLEDMAKRCRTFDKIKGAVRSTSSADRLDRAPARRATTSRWPSCCSRAAARRTRRPCR